MNQKYLIEENNWDLIDKNELEKEQLEAIINLIRNIMKLEQDLEHCKINKNITRNLDMDIKFKELYIHIHKDSIPMYTKVFKEIAKICSFTTIKSAVLLNLFLFKKF